ncbi:MAG TPA: TonB-dependent receptor, partial [Candidatus Baltobacteraceae bacterium]|nr:TonB-dependent receptor [Candidatus Baltobacteraceae bacterium]
MIAGALNFRSALCALLLTFSLFDMASAQATAPPTASGLIAGTVIDRRTALPVGGAQLVLMQGDRSVAHTVSDQSGKFTFSVLPAGIYTIQVSAEGYQIARSDDVVVTAAEADVSLAISRVQATDIANVKTIAHLTTRASGLQTTTTVQQQIDPQLMQNVGQIRAAEGLAQLPGVNLVGQDSTVGDDVSVDIRGLKPSETQVLLDGHPIGPIGVYPSRIGGGNGGFDYQDAPLFALQNTVVTFGSGATGLYGVDAVGGAVDFQTFQPSTHPQGNLKLGFGDMGTQVAAAEATGSSGKLGYAVVHGMQTTYGNFPGAIIAQTGVRGNDFTSPTLAGITYYVSGNYTIQNDLAKLQYAFSPATVLTLTTYAANSLDDKTGEGDNDFVTYDFAFYQASHNTNCTTPGGTAGISVVTDSGNQCYTPAQYAQNASGPAGGGPGAYQALKNQDYHARLSTTIGKNEIVVDSYLDNYTQHRVRPESFINGPNSILDVDYRSIGTLITDDLSFSKHDLGFGIFAMRQYTNGDNITGTNVLPHSPIFDKLDSFFVRDVYQPEPKLSFFLNAWFKNSNVGGNSFDPRLSILFRPSPNDMIRLTGGKSSADPAPLALQLTGPGGIGAGNCKLFSVGEAQSPDEQPERA